MVEATVGAVGSEVGLMGREFHLKGDMKTLWRFDRLAGAKCQISRQFGKRRATALTEPTALVLVPGVEIHYPDTFPVTEVVNIAPLALEPMILPEPIIPQIEEDRAEPDQINLSAATKEQLFDPRTEFLTVRDRKVALGAVEVVQIEDRPLAVSYGYDDGPWRVTMEDF